MYHVYYKAFDNGNYKAIMQPKKFWARVSFDTKADAQAYIDEIKVDAPSWFKFRIIKAAGV